VLSARAGGAVFWFLLPWAGLAATLVAALLGAPPGGAATARVADPTHGAGRRFLTGFLATFLLGVLLYPAGYAALFEVLERADAGVGAGLGAIHGVGALLAEWRLRGLTAGTAFRIVLARMAYGAVLGALYIVAGGPA
jgi:hypothetical protein